MIQEKIIPVGVKIYYICLFLVAAAILAPIWMVDYPGMVDYPNHLARCYILANYHDNEALQRSYAVVHDPIPNLAIDLIVVPLLRFFPLITCGKVFLSIAAVVYVLGCSALGQAVSGKPNWLALPCAFTFYNSDLLYGFVNYVFGLGVFLCVFAYWLQIRDKMSPLRFIFCGLLSIVAFLSHLSSIVFLGIACVTVSLLDLKRDRKIHVLPLKLMWLACPLLLMAAFMKNSGRVGSIVWRSPLSKAVSLFAPFRSYSTVIDYSVIVVLFACGLVFLRNTKVHSVATASLVFLALYCVTPFTLFTSAGADVRYVVPGFLLFALSIQPEWKQRQKIAVAAALMAMLIHTGSIAANWLKINRRSEQVLAMGRVLQAGARIYVVEPNYGVAPKLDRGFVHVIQFWTTSHEAAISTLFALPGQQPLVFRQLPCEGPEYDNPRWEECLAKYDYVWTYDPPASLRRDILRVATPVSVWEKVTLWRMKTNA